MAQGIPPHYTIEYSTRIQLLLQEDQALRNYCEGGTHVGKQASPINQFGALEAGAPSGRFSPIVLDEPTATRRWVFPIDRDKAIGVDNFDLLRTIEDPKPKLAETLAKALRRAQMREIIAAADRTAYTGETGVTTENWDTTYQVANTVGGSAACGLNVPKLIKADELFRAVDPMLPDDERKVLIIAPQQHSNLLRESQVTSSEFTRNGGVLDEGKVKRYMGFDIQVTNMLTKSSNDRYCLAWVSSGMYFGSWGEVYVKISERDDLSGIPWQIYSRATFGATRTQLGKVVRILCTET